MFLCGNAGKKGKKGEMRIETQEPGIRALAGSRSWAEVNMCKCSLSMENQNGTFFSIFKAICGQDGERPLVC